MDLVNVYYEQYWDDEVFIYFEKVYQLLKEYGSFELKWNVVFNMVVFWENQKNYFEVLCYRKEYESWDDLFMDQNGIYEVV